MLKKAKAEAEAQAKEQAGTQDPGSEFSQVVRESSRQIWLAGLGAFSRAQAEGTRMFESLVEQGKTLEARTKRRATETATAAAGMAAQKAKEVQAAAGGTWDKLEQVFEERVARALSRLGVHTQADVERLSQRVDTLSEAVNELIKARGGKAAGARAQGTKRAARAGGTAAGAPRDGKPATSPRARKAARKSGAG